ncbi:S-adenosyl-L-methionine-dependent methyltransferase [Tilletiaria anomala UBC 951]|uniref:S-adenosyl-L-methionine-dependent methyltransferase n=1 Tax=Tilletiaria anomala (strain ATCC 24038 / CBS 436.72 / UBC 951) TaxID=1037660 RepID=A0A066VWZ0_TILAU|nr:S-adenosyl-L-methionine-dependent methyltransferase [Tilletiaria anomala UBC 951]KDN43309.1 S-adenosyl-L-methionine-dependent methyltransferase [Tilletiaria anomala UBC 951]
MLMKTSGIQTSISYPPTAFLLSQKARLHSELVRLQLRRGAATIADLRSDGKERQKAARIPRWVRLNTARFVNQDEARDEWEQWLHETGLTPHSETEDWLNEPKTYVASRHVSNVYALHTSITSQVISSEWYQSGKIILQDLASCFPAQILASYYVRHFAIENREGSQPKCLHAVDATAAPGNKTSHLSTLLDALARPSKLNVTVSAFEKDKPRFRTLVNLLGKVGALASASTAPPKPPLLSPRAGAFNVQCFHEDFLSTDSKGDERWKDVQMMMLDPSCSGSGILGRLDHLTNHSESEVEQETDENDGSGSNSRLESLAKFQLTMIKHAMSFPALRCFTYSTCSVHEEENEQVVANALALPQARESGWRLAGREDVLPAWPQRGVKGVAGVDADALVRAAPGGAAGVQKSSCHDPHVEATNGFFVCLFVRDPPATATPASLSNKKKNKKKKKKKRGGGLGKADDSGNAGEANDEAEASDQDE